MARSKPAVNDSETITIRVPIVLRKRGGRKTVTTPDGLALSPPRSRVDGTLVKALARAFRWRKLIETGFYANIQEIAVAERVNDSYVGRVLRLTLLAPDIVQAILDGLHAPAVTRQTLMRPLPAVWEDQQAAFREAK